MNEQEQLLNDYAGWLIDRARMLSGFFNEPREDCYQALCLALLQWKSQTTAWKQVFADLQKKERLGPHQLTSDDQIKSNTPPPHAHTDGMDLLELLPHPHRECVRLSWEGLNSVEISKRLEIGQRTVRRYLEQANKKIVDILGES